MDPIQMQELLLNPLRPLDEAAKTITTTLTHANIRHGFIGGYATSLIGGGRFTNVYLLSILDTVLPANLT